MTTLELNFIIEKISNGFIMDVNRHPDNLYQKKYCSDLDKLIEEMKSVIETDMYIEE